jgi:tRNA (guanine-N7-)-methyltransferase
VSQEDPNRLRRIRSFVVRKGRITAAQERAWTEFWPHYGLETGDAPLQLEHTFPAPGPVTLEIGFGNGESLVALATAHPERNYIGIEVHRPGIGHLMLRAEEAGAQNLRVVCRDAVEVLQHCIPDGSLDEILLYFPDPWPKKRHHKRRIVQPDFVELVADKLKPQGVFRLATDWANYAEHMLEVVGASPRLRNLAADGRYVQRPESRPLTRFEQRGQRLGHEVWDLAFERR